nr:TRC40/GET3/ArsA family transport-energizing ATPase [Myxococcaceae bacterium MCy9487]
MPRIILVSGKGGVGKTTVAAATGWAAAKKGHRTLVLSFDLAHSLSDSFDQEEQLFQQHKGLPRRVAENLDLQEIDVQEELERNWKDIYRYSAALMTGGGLDEVVAEEVAIMPGMEDMVALLHLNRYVTERRYDVIVLDCPPTSEALRFVSFSTTLDWYARKRLKTDQTLVKLLRPMASVLSETAKSYLPDDAYFTALQRLFERMGGIDQMLRDPKVTSVRLVTNPEKMVVRETQRAFMYFCMYGITTDSVVINRLLPQGDGYFAQWAQAQQAQSHDIKEYFSPVPVSSLPLLSNEVVGVAQLEKFSQLLYAERDPAEFFIDAPSYGFTKKPSGDYHLELQLPFVGKEQIDLSRKDEDLVIRVGTFKRNVLLPRAIIPLRTEGASMENGRLVVRFAK